MAARFANRIFLNRNAYLPTELDNILLKRLASLLLKGFLRFSSVRHGTLWRRARGGRAGGYCSGGLTARPEVKVRERRPLVGTEAQAAGLKVPVLDPLRPQRLRLSGFTVKAFQREAGFSGQRLFQSSRR